MADTITPDERAAIEAAIAAKRVRHCAPGASAFEYVPSTLTGELVLVNRLAEEMGRATTNSWGKRQETQQAGAKRRRKKVRALHAEGLTTAAIAKKLNAVKSTVTGDLRAMGLHANPPGLGRCDAETRQRLIPQLVERGLSKPALARQLRVDLKTIYRDLEALAGTGGMVNQQEATQ